jgi:hypothetical protein
MPRPYPCDRPRNARVKQTKITATNTVQFGVELLSAEGSNNHSTTMADLRREQLFGVDHEPRA